VVAGTVVAFPHAAPCAEKQVEPKANEGRFWSEPDVGAYHFIAVAA
jgi:hypothetical protein